MLHELSEIDAHLGDLNFWRSQAYTDFFQHLDQAGGFYYERWGDAPVHSIGAALFARKDQIHFFDDIGYRHEPFQVILLLLGRFRLICRSIVRKGMLIRGEIVGAMWVIISTGNGMSKSFYHFIQWIFTEDLGTRAQSILQTCSRWSEYTVCIQLYLHVWTYSGKWLSNGLMYIVSARALPLSSLERFSKRICTRLQERAEPDRHRAQHRHDRSRKHPHRIRYTDYRPDPASRSRVTGGVGGSPAAARGRVCLRSRG